MMSIGREAALNGTDEVAVLVHIKKTVQVEFRTANSNEAAEAEVVGGPAKAPDRQSQEHTQRSGRATTTHQVRDRPDRLNDATQDPQRLGTAYLRTRTPGQVRQGHGGQYHLNRRANEDGSSLTFAEVAPPLLGSHDRHATPNGSTRPTGQAGVASR